MHEDYEYVKSLEQEVDELESEKADFSNIYDLLLEECVSKDVTCLYLHSLSDLNAYAELQCLYLHKVKECEFQDSSGLRWVSTGKLFNSCTETGTSFNGQKQQRIDLNADALYNEKQENLRVWLLKLLISKKPVPECSGLVLHQMTSDHNRSKLGIHDHNNEPSSLKLVPKVVPLAVRYYITTELNYFPHHIAIHKVVRLGINPMIQPEPEDLPKDNPKLEIAVLSYVYGYDFVLQGAYGCILGSRDSFHSFFCLITFLLLYVSLSVSSAAFSFPAAEQDVTIMMVDTRGSTPEFSGPAFEAAVQRAVDALLPGLTTRITNEIRQNGAGGSGDQPTTIHTWLERLASYKLEGDTLNWWKAFKQAKGGETYVATLSWKDFRDIFFLKYFIRSEQQKYEREYHTIRQRDEETSGEFVKRFLRLAGFVGKKVGPPEEQAK
ncbi:zinc finger, CCHC-type, retrotransposon gag domain protein [Tanacetum coccineum]|uniref:Zinc finger, CCHC-type, retrotransposon gag domain protein n=1 Tax=Tanacetum coccineum TaxID=301880 RepID=A0ABQ5GCZ3_9ASTR